MCCSVCGTKVCNDSDTESIGSELDYIELEEVKLNCTIIESLVDFHVFV